MSDREFRGRLKVKKTLWLGLRIKSIDVKFSKRNGMPYQVIRFEQAPLVTTHSPIRGRLFNRYTFWADQFQVGDVVHAEVRYTAFADRFYFDTHIVENVTRH